jgi:exodeoxyribonuclease VII large subunit
MRQDRQRVGALRSRLIPLGSRLLAPFRSAVGLGAAQLEGLSPLAVLARGYSITCDGDGHVIAGVDAVDLDERIRVRLVDGSLGCTVDEVSRL